MSNLVKYDQARLALAQCRDVDEVKEIRDKSDAMRLYAKQANDTELEQWAAEIKLRAQRAIGEISAGLEKKTSRHATLPFGGKCKAEALADAGISTSTAHRYEQLAAIPLPEVEAFIARSKQSGKPVSAKAMLAASKPKTDPEPGNGSIKNAKRGTAKSANQGMPEAVVEDRNGHATSVHNEFGSLVTSAHQQLANQRAENQALREQLHALQAQTGTPVAGTRVVPNQEPLEVSTTEHVPPLVDEAGQLRDQVAELEARLTVVMAEQKMIETILAADDKVKAAMAEAKQHKAKANEDSRALFVEKNKTKALADEVKYWKDHANKALESGSDDLIALRAENAALREELNILKGCVASTLDANENVGQVIDADDQFSILVDETNRPRAADGSAESNANDLASIWAQCVSLIRAQDKTERAPQRATDLFISIIGSYPLNLPEYDQVENVAITRRVTNKYKANKIAGRGAA